MRFAYKTVLISAIIFICLIGISYASVVTVDMTSKSAKSDVTTLDPLDVQVVDGQLGVLVKSTIIEPHDFTFRAIGLTEPSYDVWINGKLLGTKTAEQLRAGIDLRVDGRITDPNMMRCLDAVRSRVPIMLKRLRTLKTTDSQHVSGLLNQVMTWTTAAIQSDQIWRSVQIFLGPADRALYHMGSSRRKDAEGTADMVTRACWLLQQARSKMRFISNDLDLRDDAIASLTPVDLTAAYTIKNGKPHIEVKLISDCDLPARGTISLSLPQVWKSTAKSLAVSVKSCQTLCLSFNLIAPSKTAVAPSNVPMEANLTMVQDAYHADIKLKQTAVKQ